MANTYTQIHIQFVFAVKFSQALIQPEWKENLHRYITGIFQRHHHRMLQINSMPDHIHIFIGMRPDQSVSSIIQLVKSESSKWIKEQNFCSSPFAWQEGYGAFSYAKSQVTNVVRYIQNQEIHHQKESFWMNTKNTLKHLKLNGIIDTFLMNRNNTRHSGRNVKT